MPTLHYNFHQHSEYSILDCVIKIKDYVKECKDRGLDLACVTDHGSLSCCYELWKECKEQEIRPCLGVEAYFVNSYEDKYASEIKYNYGHIVMIAMNETGWNNIKKLQNIAWEKGFFRKPRVSLEDLLMYNEGIVVTTGCTDGIVGYWLHRKDLSPEIQDMSEEELHENIILRLKRFKAIFGNRLYGEVQLNAYELQASNNKFVIEHCKKLDIPIIYTGDTHYIKEEDSLLHDIVKCVQWRDVLSDPEAHVYPTKDLWFRTNAEIVQAMKKSHPYINKSDLYGWVRETMSLAKRIEDFDILPNERSMPIPETNGMPNYKYLVSMCKAHRDWNLIEKYKTYKERFARELSLLMKKQFVDYFLIVSDICDQARSLAVPFNARGSVCGSLIAYLMNITWIDPILFKCPFERFLSEDRTSMPDIDLDFSTTGRGRMIQYLQEKYGKECVANICAFSRWKPKVAIKDASRVFDVDFQESNELTKNLDGGLTWEELYNNAEVVKYFQKYESVEKYAKGLLGLTRQFSTHASGVLLTAGELTKWCPIAYQKDTKITEWDGNMLEKLGLLKVDILGVNMLDIVATAVNLIGENNKSFKKRIQSSHHLFEHILARLDDPKVYRFISTGNTVGTFQLGGSAGMRGLAKQLRPDRFNDIAAIISLHRTALLIMGMDQEYVNRKRGKEYEVIHPKAQSILKNTHGVLLYQSQTTELAHHLAGFTYLEADAFRNAIKKKDVELMKPWKKQFVDGCGTVSGIKKDKAGEIWEFIQAFSEYGFNKAHATSYAFLGYVTCWLKFYHQHEYMTALLKHNVAGKSNDKLFEYMLECCRLGIQIVKPDINNSTDEFRLIGKKIYTPMNFVKKVGEKALPKILDNRPYTSFDDFVTRSKVNVGIIHNLILSDSFKDVEPGTKEALWDRFINESKDKLRRSLYCYECKYRYPTRIDPKDTGKASCPNCNGTKINIVAEDITDYCFDENHVNEKIYGFNIWNDNLAKHIPMLEERGYRRLSDLTNDGVVKTVFEVKKIKLHRDKNKDMMAFIEVSDNIVFYDLIMFASMWRKKGDKVKKGNLYVGKFKKEGQKLVMYDSYASQFSPVNIFLKKKTK